MYPCDTSGPKGLFGPKEQRLGAARRRKPTGMYPFICSQAQAHERHSPADKQSSRSRHPTWRTNVVHCWQLTFEVSGAVRRPLDRMVRPQWPRPNGCSIAQPLPIVYSGASLARTSPPQIDRGSGNWDASAGTIAPACHATRSPGCSAGPWLLAVAAMTMKPLSLEQTRSITIWVPSGWRLTETSPQTAFASKTSAGSTAPAASSLCMNSHAYANAAAASLKRSGGTAGP